MPDTFGITILGVIVVGVILAFLKGRSRDACMRHFSGNMVTLEEKTGKTVWGILRAESTGLELAYQTPHQDKKGYIETSYVLYKTEFPNIRAIIRYHDNLSEEDKKRRDRQLRITYHPSAWKKLARKTRSMFNTVRDSVMDLVNIFVGRAAKLTPVAGAMAADKNVGQVKQEMSGFFTTSFEPLLERHIGRMVVLELTKDDKIYEYPGILKDYTAQFIEIMDVSYSTLQESRAKKADLLVPRVYGIVRHLAE